MPNWITRLQELVWPAVLAVVFAVLSVGVAFSSPESLSKVVSLGMAGITMALLAQILSWAPDIINLYRAQERGSK